VKEERNKKPAHHHHWVINCCGLIPSTAVNRNSAAAKPFAVLTQQVKKKKSSHSWTALPAEEGRNLGDPATPPQKKKKGLHIRITDWQERQPGPRRGGRGGGGRVICQV
jgi:hypothetical protein